MDVKNSTVRFIFYEGLRFESEFDYLTHLIVKYTNKELIIIIIIISSSSNNSKQCNNILLRLRGKYQNLCEFRFSNSENPALQDHVCSKAYLEPSQTSKKELFL